MAHWYQVDGTLVDGANLRQARAQNLLPSVTTILDILDKPGLNRWKMMVGPEEAERVGAETSAEGARIHDLISQWIIVYMNKEYVRPLETPGDDWEVAAEQAGIFEEDFYMLQPTLEWLQENVSREHPVMSEISLTHPMGYAGTIDIACNDKDGNRMLIDMKTRDIKTAPKRVERYFEYGIQLGGYESLLDPAKEDEHRWVSLIINRDPAKPMCVPQEWNTPDKARARRAFAALVAAWQAIKNYTPMLG